MAVTGVLFDRETYVETCSTPAHCGIERRATSLGLPGTPNIKSTLTLPKPRPARAAPFRHVVPRMLTSSTCNSAASNDCAPIESRLNRRRAAHRSPKSSCDPIHFGRYLGVIAHAEPFAKQRQDAHQFGRGICVRCAAA